MPSVIPCLWFDTEAEDAAAFYVSLLEDSSLDDVSRAGDGPAVSVAFRLRGQQFLALNGNADRPVSADIAGLTPGTTYILMVAAANERAIRFYDRHDFRVVRQVEGTSFYRAHMGVQFPPDATPVPSLVMQRTV